MSTLYCWGFGGFGGLGINTLSDQSQPVELTALNTQHITKITAGIWHSAFVSDTGALYTVGRGRYGALGTGDETDNLLIPRRVPTFGGMRVIDVACGSYHSICLTDDGQVWSFGFGSGCGHGSQQLDGFPRKINVLSHVKAQQVAAGGKYSACLTRTGQVYAWGGAFSNTPIQLKLTDIRKIVCSETHLLALSNTGAVHSLGNMRTDGNNTSTFTAPGGTRYVDIAAGKNFSMALTERGEVYVWGTLRHHEAEGVIKVPSQVVGLMGIAIKQIIAGVSWFAALAEDGSVFTWGNNMHASLGLGHKKTIKKPTIVESISHVHVNDIFGGGYCMFVSAGVSVATDMKSMLRTSLNCDLRVRSSLQSENTETFRAHRCILAARSPVLRAMLKSDTAPSSSATNEASGGSEDAENVNSAAVHDISLDIEEHFIPPLLEFIYTNSANEIPEESSEAFTNLLVSTFEVALPNTIVIKNSRAIGQFKKYIADLQYLQLESADLFGDVRFDLDDESSVWAHRCVLSCRNDYFKAMFATGMLESNTVAFPFQDATSDIFKLLMDFMYTGDADISAEASVGVLELAARLNWGRLKAVAERTVQQYIDESNVFDILNVAEYCAAKAVLRSCHYYLASNYETLKNTEQFQQLDESVKQTVVETIDAIAVGEELQAARERAELARIRQLEEDADRMLTSDHKMALPTYDENADFDRVERIMHRYNANDNGNNNNNGQASRGRNCVVM